MIYRVRSTVVIVKTNSISKNQSLLKYFRVSYIINCLTILICKFCAPSHFGILLIYQFALMMLAVLADQTLA